MKKLPVKQAADIAKLINHICCARRMMEDTTWDNFDLWYQQEKDSHIRLYEVHGITLPSTHRYLLEENAK